MFILNNFEDSNKYSWYPGHMRKARYLIKQNLKNVDLVFELRDSRAPLATKNSYISNIVKYKKKILLLGKSDLSNPSVTNLWLQYFKNKNCCDGVLAVNCKNFKQTRNILNVCGGILRERGFKKSRHIRFRAMVVGVANVGKSTLINSLVGSKKARTGNFPGVTLSKQWVCLNNNIDLLDMPGSLDVENKEENGYILELLGCVKYGAFDEENVAFELLKFLKNNKKDLMQNIFGLNWQDEEYELLNLYAKRRSFVKKGGEIDIKRAALFLIEEFRNGKFGRISLQTPKF